MNHFPIPYPDELLYSTISRAGVHYGLTSPKDLLSFVFNNRKVISTVDLPDHLLSVLGHYSECEEINLERLIYKHTLFPLYAPFVQDSTKTKCTKWLKGQSNGAVHLALGAAASRIKTNRCLRYCPKCLNEQFTKYGEYYWARIWQVPAVDSCLDHGLLLDSDIKIQNIHRHQYSEACPNTCPILPQNNASPQSKKVAKQVRILLDMKPMRSPTYDQWTRFYRDLIADSGDNKGKYICYERIQDKLVSNWTTNWLKNVGLRLTNKQSCWLRSIYRKHRKAFSYLEHIVATDEYMSSDWRIDEVIKQVLRIKTCTLRNDLKRFEPTATSKTLKYRVEWQETVSKLGVKISRSVGYGKIYTWLYRHDKDWLLHINKQYCVAHSTVNTRVNWDKRDKEIVRKLILIKNKLETDLNAARWSANWFYKQFNNASTIEKKLLKLPLTKAFIDRYNETVEDYQIRRITRTIAAWQQWNQEIGRCNLLRKSGLSEERLKPLSRLFLREIVGI